MRWMGVFALALCLTAPSYVAQAAPREVAVQAQDALNKFKKIGKKGENWKKMGFSSPQEVDQATLGVPMQVFVVHLSELQRYQPGQAVEGLVRPTEQYLYPMRHKNEDQSVFYVEKDQRGNWKTQGFGSPQMSKRLGKIREGLARQNDVALENFFVVQVPALNLVFAGFKGPSGLMMSTVIPEKDYDLRPGKAEAAAEIFKRLLPAAKAHTGDPT